MCIYGGRLAVTSSQVQGNRVTRATPGATALATGAGGAIEGGYGARVTVRNVTFTTNVPRAVSCTTTTRGHKGLGFDTKELTSSWAC